jgi:hypothetical protein
LGGQDVLTEGQLGRRCRSGGRRSGKVKAQVLQRIWTSSKMAVVVVVEMIHGIVVVVPSSVDSRSRRSGGCEITALSQRNGHGDGLAVRPSSHDSQFLHLQKEDMTEFVG